MFWSTGDDDCSKADGSPTQKTKGSVRKDEFSGFAASFRRRKGRDRSLDAIGVSKVSERDSVSVIWPKALSPKMKRQERMLAVAG